MPDKMSKQEAINEMLAIKNKDKQELSDEDIKRINELQKYLTGSGAGDSGLGRHAKSQLDEMEY